MECTLEMYIIKLSYVKLRLFKVVQVHSGAISSARWNEKLEIKDGGFES